jgi:uncharacterized protein (TIGR03083 family)
MNADEIWVHIHAERAAMAETLSSLTPEQWRAPSWCAGWSVKDVAGHLLASAEQTPLNFYKELIGAGMKFNVFADRGAKRLSALAPSELIERLKARTSTTNHPPAPVIAMLGEVVVHGDDLRRPLGLEHRVPEAALRAVADNWKKSNILIGAKRRIGGLRLRATDADWAHGDGPEVAGPLQSLVLAMTGRKGSHGDLRGDGVATLAARP